MVFPEVVCDLGKIVRRSFRPANPHRLRPQHPLHPSVHLFFLDQLAAVGLVNADLNGVQEPPVFVEQTKGSIFDQLLSIGANELGNRRQPRFLLGS